MTRILIGLLAAAAIAIVVLSLMLQSANASLNDCNMSAVLKDAVAKQTTAVAERAVAAAKHVVGPGAPLSRAVDLFVPGQEGGSYDKGALCYIAGVMEAAAQSLGISIRWGGDFDGDGLLLEKGTFIDAPHFELN